MRLSFYTTAKDGQISIDDKALLAFEGKRVEVVVSAAKKRRSNPQNAYYWGIMLPIVRNGFVDAGNEGVSVEDVHYFLKKRFLPEGKELIIPGSGEVVTLPKSTAALDTIEFGVYMERIAQFASEFLGMAIPEPNAETY